VRIVAFLQALVLAVLLACAGPSTSNADQKSAGPGLYASSQAVCALVKNNDLGAALGRRFLPGTEGFPNSFVFWTGITRCMYPPAESGYKEVDTGIVYAYAREIFDKNKKVFEGRPAMLRPKVVSGPWDDGFWDPTAAELIVLRKDKAVALYAGNAALLEPPSDLIERLGRLAASAIDRLK